MPQLLGPRCGACDPALDVRHFGRSSDLPAADRPPPPPQGSTAISSDAYFGREQRGGGGASGASGADLTASDLVSKISLTARQDMDNIKQARVLLCGVFSKGWCCRRGGLQAAGLVQLWLEHASWGHACLPCCRRSLLFSAACR